jgi:hypothetical protein
MERQMRVTRAFMASCGAGLCLVAASVAVLFVVSAIVSVRGWPGMDPADDVPHVRLAEAPGRDGAPHGDAGAVAVSAANGDAVPIVLGGSAAPAPAAAAPGDGSPRRGSERSRQVAPTDGDGQAPAVRAPVRERGPAAAGNAPELPSPTTRPRPTPAATVTTPAADAIRDRGEDAADAADEVVPGTGRSVRDVTDAVAGTVQDTGQAVGGPVEKVTDRTSGTVQEAGQAVDSVTKGDVGAAVEHVTDAVGALLGASK